MTLFRTDTVKAWRICHACDETTPCGAACHACDAPDAPDPPHREWVGGRPFNPARDQPAARAAGTIEVLRWAAENLSIPDDVPQPQPKRKRRTKAR